jgi:predicted lipoprotein with Yx(FWY)xxD motif
MFRMRMGLIAAATAAGALMLTACGPADTGAASSSAAPASAAPAAGTAQNGTGNLSLLPGTAAQNNAPANTGDLANQPGKPTTPAGLKWVQLSAAKAGALDPVVIDGAGFTLYRFDPDSANPSKATCNDACAVTWPPVVIDPQGKIFVDGVDKSAVGAVKRDDGSLQVTVGGWPVYRFSKDLKPGDTNGQGVGGTWFGVTPDGQKAGQNAGGTAGAAGGGQATGGQASGGQASGGAAKPATSAVLFDDANFADNGSQGLSGKGCQNVTRDNVASSLQTDGSLKIWSEANCTGKSKIVDGNVADLSTVGLDNDVSSVFFG